jgi:hypothetical protein
MLSLGFVPPYSIYKLQLLTTETEILQDSHLVPTGSQAGQHGSSMSYCMTKGQKTSQQNWCNASLYAPSKGSTDGEVIFVYVDCAKGGLLQNQEIPQDPNTTDGPAAQPPAIFYPDVFTGSNAGH